MLRRVSGPKPDAGGGAVLTTQNFYYGINPDPNGGSGLVGQVQAVQDPNMATTRYSYNAFGRLIAAVRPDDTLALPTTTYAYYDTEQPFRVVTTVRETSGCSGCNQPTVTFYDGLGRVIQTKTESQNGLEMIVTDTRYHALGAVAQQYAPYKRTNPGFGDAEFWGFAPLDTTRPKTTTQYDALGRPVAVTQPDGATTETRYAVETIADSPGVALPRRVTYTIDPNRRFVRRAADGFGNLRVVSENLGAWPAGQPEPTWGDTYHTYYTYDALDRLVTVTDHAGNATTLTYDLLGRKTQTVDPDMGTWQYGYDARGNLTRQTDAKDQRICFYYDGHNRLKGKTYSSGTADCPADPGYGGYAVKHYYDTDENGLAVSNGRGRRTVLFDASGSTRWRYDTRGRTTRATKAISGLGGGTFVTEWGYDAADRTQWQRYPANNAGVVGEQVNLTYNAQGLLRQVQSTGTTYVGETLYNALGQVTERWLGAGTGAVRQLYTYSAAENFRLVSMQAGNAAPYTNLQNIGYTYDDVGNVLTITDAAAWGGSQTQTFTYDALHRLKTAQASGGTGYGDYPLKTYGYDPIGNLTSFEASALTYEDVAHKHAVTHIGGVQKYWYDANGNATKRLNGSQNVTLNYDTENRLTELSYGVTASYAYDGDGNRVKATAGGVTTVYIGNYFEWTGSTTTMKSYLYAGGTRVAERSGGTLYYLLGDHLGSQALTLTSAGARLNTNTELRYFPYGVARYTAGTTPTSFNFTGQRKDAGSGLLFYNARWYDPVVGRFLQADTIVPQPGSPQSLNRYSYGLGNPVKYRDPSGHWVESALDIAGIIFDANDIRTNGLNWENGLSLAADIGGLILPGVTGGGVLVRAVAHADDVVDVARTAAHAGDAASVIDRVTDAGKALLSKGARGAASGREFDAAKSVIPIRKLSTGNVKITDKGIDAVQKHLARFGKDSPNEVMVDRLRKIAAGEIEAAESDINFYTHELREYTRHRQAGWATGQPFDADEAYDLWNNLHTATLEDYGLLDDPSLLYSADAGVP